MSELNDRINSLSEKLEALLKKQDGFYREIVQLRSEISQLKSLQEDDKVDSVIQADLKKTVVFESERKEQPTVVKNVFNLGDQSIAQSPRKQEFKMNSGPVKMNLEKFIGENLISKIGIIITIIGIAIGAKYSIEHHLISPLTRIIIGYLIGLCLLITGIKLKSKYETYSAVLVSGAMAILYFITYAAYSFYQLIPQVPAFAMMVIFTAFTVLAAIKYNQQVIAHIGLVGAYAVPFLLSEGEGKEIILFTYMAIINAGILTISVKKYWKSLYYASFALTWIIYSSWLFSGHFIIQYFNISFTFLTIFFLIFYTVFLVYKLIQKEQFEMSDVVMIFINSFIFYGIGYRIISYYPHGDELLGLYTLVNATIHFLIGIVIYRQKLADRNLFYLVAGLVLVFITITIPVQLDGNWVTLLWVFETVLLFNIGRKRNIGVYEKLSYVMIGLSFLSLGYDWFQDYGFLNTELKLRWTPILNIHFLSSILFTGAFVTIHKLNTDKSFPSPLANEISLRNLINFLVPAILIISVYFAFKLEISHYFQQLYADSVIMVKHVSEGYTEPLMNEDLMQLDKLWYFNYSMVFFILLGILNIKKIQNRQLGLINLAFSVFFILLFITDGFGVLSELRDHYLHPEYSKYFKTERSCLGIRYISFGLMAITLYIGYLYSKQPFLKIDLTIPFDAVLHLTVLCIISNELMNWMELSGALQSDKLGLSILWGLYALFLISFGIWKKRKHIRLGAIALFAVTLLKLFFYDLSELNTIAKTVVFVSLGILLLIISFLYHKFKALIADEN